MTSEGVVKGDTGGDQSEMNISSEVQQESGIEGKVGDPEKEISAEPLANLESPVSAPTVESEAATTVQEVPPPAESPPVSAENEMSIPAEGTIIQSDNA